MKLFETNRSFLFKCDVSRKIFGTEARLDLG